jgi:hypothetical protein
VRVHDKLVHISAKVRDVLYRKISGFYEGKFSVLTGVTRLNIIGAKLYKFILAVGERKRGLSLLETKSIFVSLNAKILLAPRRGTFHSAIIRRLG